jgi:hypothetical protein
MIFKTVGELRKFLEQFDDDKPLSCDEVCDFVKVDDMSDFISNLTSQGPVVFMIH